MLICFVRRYLYLCQTTHCVSKMFSTCRSVVSVFRAGLGKRRHNDAHRLGSRCFSQLSSPSDDNGIAVVTGASGCLGRAIALELGKHGCKVVVHYMSNEQAAMAVVEDITAAGGTATPMQADLRDQEQAAALFKEAAASYSKHSLQICVNSAGIIRDSLAVKMQSENWRDVIDLDLTAPFFSAQAAFTHMMRQKFGRIINVASIVGQIGNVGQANYAAAKGGMIAMTRSLAKEFAKRNVTVNAVCPGYIESKMTALLPNNDEIVQQIPLGRLGTPEEVAGLVAFLAVDPAAAYMTGHAFNVDGGIAIGST